MGLARTKIPWTDFVYNPTSGCNGPHGTRCPYCYASRISHRFKRSFAPTFHPERVNLPYQTKKPGRVFVDSNGDLFDPAITFHQIAEIYSVMIQANWHTYQILTKQAARMLEFYERWGEWFGPGMRDLAALPHIHLGVSITNQPDADERIPVLLQTPAAVHFVSVEPLLSAVSLYALDWTTEARRQLALVGIDYGPTFRATCDGLTGERWDNVIATGAPGWRGLDWCIIGALTGPGAKPPKREWIEDIVRQCKGTGVPLFLKGNLRPAYQGELIQQWPEVAERG